MATLRCAHCSKLWASIFKNSLFFFFLFFTAGFVAGLLLVIIAVQENLQMDQNWWDLLGIHVGFFFLDWVWWVEGNVVVDDGCGGARCTALVGVHERYRQKWHCIAGDSMLSYPFRAPTHQPNLLQNLPQVSGEPNWRRHKWWLSQGEWLTCLENHLQISMTFLHVH